MAFTQLAGRHKGVVISLFPNTYTIQRPVYHGLSFPPIKVTIEELATGLTKFLITPQLDHPLVQELAPARLRKRPQELQRYS